MKTISRRIFTITPIIAFALTIIISNGISRAIEHHHAATTDCTQSTDEMLNGSYRTMLESLNSISTR